LKQYSEMLALPRNRFCFTVMAAFRAGES